MKTEKRKSPDKVDLAKLSDEQLDQVVAAGETVESAGVGDEGDGVSRKPGGLSIKDGSNNTLMVGERS